jgi:GDPmannose 4,6-dehydratase
MMNNISRYGGMKMKKALITGITGQDGSYLTEFLLEKGYEVHGVIRRSSTFNTDRIDHLYHDPHKPATHLFLHYGDLSDGTGLRHILEAIQPDEVYNLAAQSHVRVSFLQAEYTADIVATGTLRLLEAIRDHNLTMNRVIRFYQAGSSEMFGDALPPQSEKTPFHPCSPYAASKVAAHWYTVNYRESYGMFNCNGILFNHESPRRGETFVTRKITRALTRIKFGLQDVLYLGNIEAKRDWGFSGDYVEAMWLMLQQPEPDDYAVATGESHSVREFLEEAGGYLELDWQSCVKIDPQYYRPREVDVLQGDFNKAATKLGWAPKVNFKQLIRMMIDHDLKMAEQEQLLREAGLGPDGRHYSHV